MPRPSISLTIDTQARSSAAALLAQGWEPLTGSAYHLHACPGDLEALEARIGRRASRDERLALEAAIRLELDLAPLPAT